MLGRRYDSRLGNNMLWGVSNVGEHGATLGRTEMLEKCD